jgi:enoyl-CoA hydratase/carnithine racemase
VLRGAGRHFQAGADLAFLQHLRTVPPDEKLDFSRRTLAAIDGLRHFSHPTVALIQGGCFGGGVGIAAACDIAVAAEDAVFAISEVQWGITAAPIIALLVDRLGSRAVGRFALTGERFAAAEALRIGLVHQLWPGDGLEAAAALIVENILMAAPKPASFSIPIAICRGRVPLASALRSARSPVRPAWTCRASDPLHRSPAGSVPRDPRMDVRRRGLRDDYVGSRPDRNRQPDRAAGSAG